VTLTEFNPYVRFMDRRNYVSTYPEFIMAYDHRLFYIDSGEIEADINGQNYTICQNQILLIPPQTPYKLSFHKPYEFTVFNFDPEPGNPPDYGLVPQPAETFDEQLITSSERLEQMPVHCNCPVGTKEIVDEIYRIFEHKDLYYTELVSSLTKTLLVRSIKFTVQDHAPASIERIIRFLEVHYTQQITNEFLGEHFSYHPNYLNKLFRQHTGKTLHAFQTDIRLRKAADLLSNSELSVGQIGEQCGFATNAYFIKIFRQKYGIPPGKYRKRDIL
jgi:AraC-like DNA-binding protein